MEVGMELVTRRTSQACRTGIARAAAARTVAGWQFLTGTGPRSIVRPPQSYGLITATAIAIRGVQALLAWRARRRASAERTPRERATGC